MSVIYIVYVNLVYDYFRRNLKKTIYQLKPNKEYTTTRILWCLLPSYGFAPRGNIRHDHPDIDYKQSISHSKPAIGLEWLYTCETPSVLILGVQHRLGGYIYGTVSAIYVFVLWWLYSYGGCFVWWLCVVMWGWRNGKEGKEFVCCILFGIRDITYSVLTQIAETRAEPQ